LLLGIARRAGDRGATANAGGQQRRANPARRRPFGSARFITASCSLDGQLGEHALKGGGPSGLATGVDRIEAPADTLALIRAH